MTAITPVPLAHQPPWLRELRQVVAVYPPDPDLPAGAPGYGAALCRWCDLTWPLDLAGLEADPLARAFWIMGVAEHGLEHAAAGDLRLDAAGEPLDDDDDDLETEGLGWPN